MGNNEPVRVAVAGLGRSGWDIHIKALQRVPEQFRVVAVLDNEPSRQQEAREKLGCRVANRFDDFIADPEVELIVIATPSHLHAPQAIASVRGGKHVVCEKPMATSLADAEKMVAAARESSRLLSVFFNRRYSPDFVKVREVIESGILGRIVQIRVTVEQFARRWDWQTLKEFGGGLLNNHGSHNIDLALQLFGPAEPQVLCDLQRAITSGDAEDYVKVVLRAPGAPTIDVELTSAAAYPHDVWNIMGTSGGLRGSHTELQWKWLDWNKLPPRPVDRNPVAADRIYTHKEELPWQVASWKVEGDAASDWSPFYRDLFSTIRLGKPQAITPESALRTMALLQKCRALAAEPSCT